MPLATGTRLGNYEILAPLGAGGMGEVYRARDVRLDRPVAIKALPEAFARDPERLARFEREARLLASVQHPHIAVIFGIEDAGETSYLALELVEGETLALRLGRGPLTPAETLELGAQIASALDAAHERGIVHRDLKPGNVMVTSAGVAKVLDFGLAKQDGPLSSSAVDLSLSPTVALAATGAGVLLGTAPYMSPEQARGRPVDRRADIWALGCVLYECLAGRPAFAGDTSSDVIARILERDPDWDALPAATPTRLRDLVRRCLTKAASERPRDAGDVRGEMLAIVGDLSGRGRATRTDARPSLAVLYFENLSAGAESEYFCSGITEDILTDLSKLKGLRVASRNAVARYRGAPADIGQVARELGVGSVLEGSVRRAGDRVRITAQLISADGFHLWAERFDRTLDDVFAVQEEIASAIAKALEVALAPGEARQIAVDRPADVRAYDLYLRGREEYRRYSPESLREAERLFEQAIEVDPSYALAWAGLGDVCGQLVQWGVSTDRDAVLKRGLDAARRAIALNPRLAEGHKAEALVLGLLGDEDAALTALERAVEVNSRYTPALGNLGVNCFRHADLAGAERWFRRSLDIEPHDPFTLAWVATLCTFTERRDEAETIIARIHQLASDTFHKTLAHMSRVALCFHTGRPGELERNVAAARADGADAANLAMVEAFIAARAGQSDAARRLLETGEQSGALNLAGLMLGAAAALLLGEPKRAAALFNRPLIGRLAQVVVRLETQLHVLLGVEPFAPSQSALTLVWPLEAPMIDAARHRVFADVRIASSRPDPSGA